VQEVPLVDAQDVADPFPVAHVLMQKLQFGLHEDLREEMAAVAFEGGRDGSVECGGVGVAVEDESG
jgi:hypothetical protein